MSSGKFLIRTLAASLITANMAISIPAFAQPNNPGQGAGNNSFQLPTFIPTFGAGAGSGIPSGTSANNSAPPTFESDIETLFNEDDSFKPSDRPSDGGEKPDGGEGYALRRLEEGVRIGRQAGPGNNFGDQSENSFSTNDNPGIGRLTGANTWCRDSNGNPTDCIAADEAKLRTTPGKKVTAMNFLSPMSGVTDTLNSKAYVDQITGNLSSPFAVLAATLNLTEPALARAMMDSMQVAGTNVQARLAADQAILSRAQAFPGTGATLAANYDTTMVRERASGKSWIEAQGIALSGERNVAGANSPQPFNAVNTTPVDFKKDPNHPSNNPEAGLGDTYYDGSPIKDNVIRGLDFLFNRALSFPVGQTPPAEHKEAMKKLRRSFERMIGDVQLTIGAPNANFSPDTTIETADGAIAVEVSRIPPTERTEQLFQKLVIDRYKDIHALLSLRCKYELTPIQNSSSDLPEIPREDDGEFKKPSNAKGNFWADYAGAHQLLIRLSTIGFRPSPKLFEALFAKFKDESSGDVDATSCAALSTKPGKPSDISALLSQDKSKRGQALATNSKERIQAAFFLAERIAFGQFLGTMAQAEDFVAVNSTGGYDSLVREHMLDAIHTTAGTNQIDLAMDRNNKELNTVNMEIAGWYTERNVASSAPITGSYAEGGGNKGSINNTTGQ